MAAHTSLNLRKYHFECVVNLHWNSFGAQNSLKLGVIQELRHPSSKSGKSYWNLRKIWNFNKKDKKSAKMAEMGKDCDWCTLRKPDLWLVHALLDGALPNVWNLTLVWIHLTKNWRKNAIIMSDTVNSARSKTAHFSASDAGKHQACSNNVCVSEKLLVSNFNSISNFESELGTIFFLV